MSTLRETTAILLRTSASVKLAAGLDSLPVLQAESVVSPTKFPFIVLRWMSSSPGLEQVRVRPFMIWAYDELGDYTRAERIVHAAAAELKARSQIKTDTGWILAFEERVGDGQGEDMIDSGQNAFVVPYSLTAVASGS